MMFLESAHIRINLHHGMLIVALTVFVKDLGGIGGGVQAWTYHYSPRMKWEDGHIWCKKHFTGLVVIHNEEETAFVNDLVPFTRRYYWIGIKKVEKVWTWVDANKTVPLEAQNWATGEPDNITGQDCVEIYIKRDNDTAKWNNEMCHHRKAALCYRDSCIPDSCSVHADCVETVGNYTCQCHPGFIGPRCQEAKQCPVLNETFRGGRMNCSHPFAPHSYNSTCEVGCNEGYELHGYDLIRCDHTGQWTASLPTCEVKQCSPIFFPITGNMTCVDAVKPFSFGSQCDFTCQEGYRLVGNDTLTCLASGNWSEPLPTCTMVQCNSLKSPPHASMQCHGLLGEHSYGSMCALQCEEGFELIGNNITKCSASGHWSHPHPVCRAKKCPALKFPPHGSLVCTDPHGSFSFGSECVSACDKGFFLNGTANTECTSMGIWNADVPECLAKKCPALNSPPHGSLVCADPHGSFRFGSTCVSTCDKGFFLNGTANTECTSLGSWSTDVPQCLAKKCPALNSPPHGFINCTDPHGSFSFGSTCVSTCDKGFFLNGTANTECTFLGSWSTDVPQCLAQKCPALNSPPHGFINCTDPHGSFSFGSTCVSTCDKGFFLNGTANTECISSGSWSTDVPQCIAKKCPALNSPPHGFINCTDPHGAFSFGSKCVSSCESGFLLNASADTECTAQATWSREAAHCLARPCPLLAKPPHYGNMNCSHPYSLSSFGSHCNFECEEGFWLKGRSSVLCNATGHWSENLPTCQPVQCKAIPALSLPLSMNCSHPLGNFSFGSQCLFSCEEGFSLNGTDVLFCSSSGIWNNSLPTCKAEGLPVGTAMLLYTGVGAASAVVPLVLIGLAMLVMTRCRKRGNSILTDEHAWDENVNPAFES
ncbi:P-selectin isoform X2 [Sphaeramia orbicularis]|uniref:E-selectin n=1 Tax=Sphaeramia orbicularis TaxID=375764 RepID=A0A673A0K4_9TELE|nr:E-selectin-like isoform X2 [Sphaeramia orbicularis]